MNPREMARDPLLADMLALLDRIDDDRQNLIFYEGDQPYELAAVTAAIEGGFLEMRSDNDWLDAGERFAYELTAKGREAIGLPRRLPFWQRLFSGRR